MCRMDSGRHALRAEMPSTGSVHPGSLGSETRDWARAPCSALPETDQSVLDAVAGLGDSDSADCAGNSQLTGLWVQAWSVNQTLRLLSGAGAGSGIGTMQPPNHLHTGPTANQNHASHSQKTICFSPTPEPLGFSVIPSSTRLPQACDMSRGTPGTALRCRQMWRCCHAAAAPAVRTGRCPDSASALGQWLPLLRS